MSKLSNPLRSLSEFRKLFASFHVIIHENFEILMPRRDGVSKLPFLPVPISFCATKVSHGILASGLASADTWVQFFIADFHISHFILIIFTSSLFLLQVQFIGTNLSERGSRSGRKSHIVVLLRQGSVVLRWKKTSIPRLTFARCNVVEEGNGYPSYFSTCSAFQNRDDCLAEQNSWVASWNFPECFSN